LNAQNDILLAAAADTRQTTGKNSSKGGGVGVSFGGGTNGGGLSIFASINGSKGSEKGSSTTWTETTLDAGKNVSLTSGRDTTLSGAQVSGEKVTADVGNNLTISSLQDSDRYDSRQNSVAAGGSFTFGSMSGSGYASISQDKIKSNYDSVREQSGIYAGKDGFDVTVGNHTQLNGAVIASTATDDKNSLSTGTLGWSDIHNQADYKASHTGISLSGGSGMSASQMVASNAIAGAANALTGMSGSSGHAEGTTSSAISGGNLIIRNKESQKQGIAGLSRDPENANGSIAPIFDREKEQKRLQEAQVISQISGQMSNIVMTYGETEAMKAARKEHPGMSDAQLRETPEYREVMKGYGTGSTPQMVVQAITGVLGGLNAGNPGQVLAGGLNPAVAQLIKQATGDNREANLMAHAVWGALAAQLGGNNAASGAAGAFSGELAARYIIDNYYGGRTDSLSEQERQQISMLATIASGIAGGLAGNSTTSAGTGAQAGRNSAENNMLNVIATETAANTAAAIAGATGNASKDTGNDNSWDTGGGCEGSREQCAVRDPSRDGARGPGHVLNGDNTDENKQPNLGKDVASATDKEKAELGGADAGTPGGWEPQDEENARNNESIEQRNEKTSSENVPNSSEKLPWDSWQNYRKVTVDGRQYAQIGHRLYSQHAVDRMQPSGLGSPAGTVGPGRNITPNMVESVIKEGTPQNSVVNGVTRTTYWSGDVGVVTENNSNIIVTILRRSGQ
ncbi:TPA: hemagglutinin repeat-containing protein, partial [Escherichia coli]